MKRLQMQKSIKESESWEMRLRSTLKSLMITVVKRMESFEFGLKEDKVT